MKRIVREAETNIQVRGDWNGSHGFPLLFHQDILVLDTSKARKESVSEVFVVPRVIVLRECYSLQSI